LNPPYKITLRCHTFLSIGVFGGWGCSGLHAFKQTEACEPCLISAYPPQAQQLVLGHALDVVQVDVKDAFLVVFFLIVVVAFIVAIVLVVVIVFLVTIVVIVFLVPDRRRGKGVKPLPVRPGPPVT